MGAFLLTVVWPHRQFCARTVQKSEAGEVAVGVYGVDGMAL